MELEDTTGLGAKLFRGEPDPGIMLAVIVAKAAYEIRPDGTVEPRPDELVEVLEEPTATPLGLLPSDHVPYRVGVDLFVHAQAYAPGGQPTPAMQVSLSLGQFTHTLLVVGQRRWTRGSYASDPEPFVTMPLTYAHAYGGMTSYRGQPVAYPDNPEGRGFVCEAEAVEGTELPNIEDPNQRISSWQDRRTPMGWAPIPAQTGVHLRRSIEVIDLDSYSYRFTPHVFSSAHPQLVFPELPAGTRGMLMGVDETGRMPFVVPTLELAADVELGPKNHQLSARLDTLGILVEQRRLIATYRTSFRYAFTPRQSRRVRLRRIEP
jgi:hypothetical protein